MQERTHWPTIIVADDPTALENGEIELLLEMMCARHGYDFRDYNRASLRRRVGCVLRAEGLARVASLRELVLRDQAAMNRLVMGLSVNVTSMFRDPEFFRALRCKVVPLLRTYPFVRVWCAGCSTGEEVYSLAILFEEEGLYDRCRIYATDLNETVLRKGREGVFTRGLMAEYSENYQRAGGKRSLADYYTAAYEHVLFRSTLRRNLVFAQHNLVTDASFNEFHLILCRNVMIYFNQSLQNRVHRLLFGSLVPLGLLCLGNRESLRLSLHERDYEPFDSREKVFRRIE
jgi:chemotaxis protein methyltransferase CheR